jgi:hypothetical protein
VLETARLVRYLTTNVCALDEEFLQSVKQCLLETLEQKTFKTAKLVQLVAFRFKKLEERLGLRKALYCEQFIASFREELKTYLRENIYHIKIDENELIRTDFFIYLMTFYN